MFIGTFHHRIQANGRLAIPAQFRGLFTGETMLTKGQDHHLNLLPFNTWNNLIAEFTPHPLEPKASRDLRRQIAHSTHQVTFDDQGRITIPESLTTFARLKTDVVLAGSLHWVEIWDRDRYFDYQDQNLLDIQETQ